MGHRRFLEKNYSYRRNKNCFDNIREEKLALKALSEDDVIAQLNTSSEWSINYNIRKRKRDAGRLDNWKKKSIFLNFRIEGLYY